MSLILGFPQFIANSQVATVAAGNNILSSAGSISYSIGQIDYTNYDNSVKLYFGIQQVYDPFVIPIDLNIGISIWPNPVFTTLHIDVKSLDNLDFLFQIYSLDGKLMDAKQSFNKRTTFNVMHYAQATYVLLIRLSNKRLYKFMIIKN